MFLSCYRFVSKLKVGLQRDGEGYDVDCEEVCDDEDARYDEDVRNEGDGDDDDGKGMYGTPAKMKRDLCCD